MLTRNNIALVKIVSDGDEVARRVIASRKSLQSLEYDENVEFRLRGAWGWRRGVGY